MLPLRGWLDIWRRAGAVGRSDQPPAQAGACTVPPGFSSRRLRRRQRRGREQELAPPTLRSAPPTEVPALPHIHC